VIGFRGRAQLTDPNDTFGVLVDFSLDHKAVLRHVFFGRRVCMITCATRIVDR
jgi:hypothetical protein